jgi:hypothetical protein
MNSDTAGSVFTLLLAAIGLLAFCVYYFQQ